jgi:hypothetical protein
MAEAHEHEEPNAEARAAHDVLITAALAAVSVWLFFFVLFKLLGFFMMTVNLLVCVLLIGHPLGVVIAYRYYRDRWPRAFQHFAAVLVLTLAGVASLQFMHPDYLAVFGLEQRAFWMGIAFVCVCGLICLPYFVYSGVVEYAVLETARRRGRSLSRLYGLLVATTLSGLLAGHLLLGVLGSVGLLAISLCLALAAAAPRARTWLLGLGLVLASIAAATPSLERGFIHAIQPKEQGRAGEFLQQEGVSSVHAAWGKHSYVEMLRMHDITFGSYNAVPYFDVSSNTEQTNHNFYPDLLLMQLIPEGGRLGLIGAGGGRQVQEAFAARRGLQVDAFEIEPETAHFFRDIDPAANGGAFLWSGVELKVGDGRTLVRSSPNTYDAVYIADAGNFFSQFRTMLNATHFLHTRDAYADYLTRMNEGGVLGSLIMLPIDGDLNTTQRVVNSMHAVGLETMTLESAMFRLTIGFRSSHAAALRARVQELAPGLELTILDVGPDMTIDNPVPTDDRGGSYIYSIYPIEQLERGFGLVLLSALGLLSLAAVIGARRRQVPTTGVLVASGLGAGFAVLQNAFILALARDLLELTDAVFVGSALFLSAAMAGALAARKLAQRPLLLPVALLVGVTLTGGLLLGIGSGVPLLLAGVLLIATSGAMFPMLLDTCDEASLPTVFAADGLGAMIGTIVVFFTPVLYGINSLIWVALALTLGMGVAVAAYVRRTG